MARNVVVVIDDLDDLGPVEQFIVSLAAREDVGLHVVSAGAIDQLVAPEAAPRRLRLMLLMARLADRLIPVTGEEVDHDGLRAALLRHAPDQIVVASRSRRVQRWLRRDTVSRLRRLCPIEVATVPHAA